MPVTVKGVAQDLRVATVPALRDLAVASGGFVLANYGGSVLLRGSGSFVQGLAQAAAGIVTMVAGRRARLSLVETAGFGAGMSGVVKVLYAVLTQVQATS